MNNEVPIQDYSSRSAIRGVEGTRVANSGSYGHAYSTTMRITPEKGTRIDIEKLVVEGQVHSINSKGGEWTDYEQTSKSG